MRLDKYLAQMSMGTRSEVKKFIKSGRVFVNGAPASGPEQKVTEEDDVELDGEKVSYERYVYYMLNKPQGVVSATKDNTCRTVLSLITDGTKKDLFPVGRLDKDTEGLLLLTNEGGLAHELLSPKKHVDKEYYVRVTGRLTEADSAAFAEGLHLDGGLICQPAELRILTSGEESEARVILREGKFHQIKRMLAYLGKPVLYLERVRMGNLLLDPALERGTYRLLTAEEWLALAKLTEETGKTRNFNKKESDFLLKKEKTSCNPTK